jgi:hypothetical protein
MKKLTLASVLTFGKHNGKTVEWVVDNDPSYILWIDENTDWIVSNTVYAAAKKEAKNQKADRYRGDIGDLPY